MRPINKHKTKGFDVFLCHNSEDKPAVKAIGERLKAKDLRPWLDEWELRPGYLWQPALEEQIEDIESAAVFVGPSGMGPWHRMELNAFLDEFVKRGCPVIPVLLPGVSKEPQLPVFLRGFTWVDFRQEDPDPLERLIWGITGEKYTGNQRDAELAYLQRLEQKKLQHIQRGYAKMEGVARKSETKAIPSLPPWMMRPEFEHLHTRSRDPDGERAKLRRFDDVVNAFTDIPRAALLGEPGAGKTTTLFKIASDALERARTDTEAAIPILVELGKWTAPKQRLTAFLKAQLGPLTPHLDTLLESRRALLLLDGLNEIPVADRDHKIPQLEILLEDNTEARIIVSCRDLDYRGSLELGLDTVTIRPLEPRRILEFLVASFKVIYEFKQEGEARGEDLFWRIAGGEEVLATWRHWESAGAALELFWSAEDIPRENPNVYASTSARDDEIWRKVVKSPHSLMHLAGNPYMLSMLFQVYLRSGDLPANRSALFDDFVRILLEREHLIELETKETTPQGEQLLSAVEGLAWALQTRGPRDTPGTDGVLTSLPRAAVTEIMDSRMLRLSASASLLEIDGEVRFTHQLLQEYFTACGMQQRLQKAELDAAALWPKDRWWVRSGWEEAAILLAGRYAEDCTPVLEWLMAANPEVAELCIERSGAHTPGPALERLREEWLPRLTDIEEDPNPAARAAVGRALGGVRLHGQPLDNRRGVGLRFDPIKNFWLPDIDWVEIPTGPFIYQDGEKQTLPLFYVSRYPITNAQFHAFVDDPKGYGNPSWWEGLAERFEHPQAPRWSYANHPRETVSWYEAMAFCAWLSAHLETQIRLPTEKKWEKAARGVEGNVYPWGNDYISGFANIDETYGGAGEHNIRQTTAVGLYPQGRSPYGVMDMEGNVWEWCLNKYDETEDTSIGGEDWRVVRGGSWGSDLDVARTDYRNHYYPNDRYGYFGFRVCCASPIKRTPGH